MAFCLSPGGCWVKPSQHIRDHFFRKPGSSGNCLDLRSKWEAWVKSSLQLEGIGGTQVSKLLHCYKEQRREAAWIDRKSVNTDTVMQSQSKATVCKKMIGDTGWIYHLKWDLSCFFKSMWTCLSVFRIKPSSCAVSPHREHVTALFCIQPFSYFFDFILFCHTPFTQCLFFTSSRILNLSNLLSQGNETQLSFMNLYFYEDFLVLNFLLKNGDRYMQYSSSSRSYGFVLWLLL